jgi:hypothetical protein
MLEVRGHLVNSVQPESIRDALATWPIIQNGFCSSTTAVTINIMMNDDYSLIKVTNTVCLCITDGMCSWKCVHIMKFCNAKPTFQTTAMLYITGDVSLLT